jgi:hypothetical protein
VKCGVVSSVVHVGLGANPMWNLDDQSQYGKILEFQLAWATTFADTREGHRDREKRERIRQQATLRFQKKPEGVEKWAFRILVSKGGRRRFDIANVGKLIIDAFCERQIREDSSSHTNLAL